MAIDITQIDKQNKKAKAAYSPAAWKKRYPEYEHDTKLRPLTLPKLYCRIAEITYTPDNKIQVRAKVTNVGSGPSTHTKVQFYFTIIPMIAVVIGQPVPPQPNPGELMELDAEETITVEPGETRELTFTRSQPPIFQNWQVAVLAFDPMADTLPMAAWHTLMQPLRNLLKTPDNPPSNRNVPNWSEYDDPGKSDSDKLAAADRTWRGRSSEPTPVPRTSFMGTALSNPTYFAPKLAGNVSELRQRVSVTQFEPLLGAGDLAFRLSGFVRSYDQSPADTTQMLLECLAGSKVVAELDLGVRRNVDAWHFVAGELLAPPGTTKLRVRLRSRRRSGGNNDGYYDVLSLTPTHRQISTLDRSSIA